jgi:hypothetical protein
MSSAGHANIKIWIRSNRRFKKTGSGCLPRLLSDDYRAISVGLQRPERKADYSPPPSVEVINARSYTSTLPYVFMAWYLFKLQDNSLWSDVYSGTRANLSATVEKMGVKWGITSIVHRLQEGL